MAKTKKKNDSAEIAVMDLGIKCLLSGVAPKTEELVNDIDESGDIVPLGWLRITVERTVPNPEYVSMFQAREAMIGTAFEQAQQQALAANKILNDEEKEGAAFLLRKSFEAQFAYSLATTPKYVTVEEESWVAAPENSKGVQREWNQLANVLDVEIATTDDGVKGEDE